MSSFKMHIAISLKIKEELNLDDDFLLGSILPDVYKIIIQDKKITHNEIKIENEDLPDINNFIEIHKDKKSNIFLGYIAHLIEDKIWFKKYIYGKYNNNVPTEDMYNDYRIIDKYIVQKYNLNILDIKKKILLSVDDLKYRNIDLEKVRKVIDEELTDCSYDGKINIFTKEDADEYFNIAYKETKKVIEKLLIEWNI